MKIIHSILSVFTLFTIVLLWNTMSVNAQVSISTDSSSPDNSSMLDIKSTNKGIIIPRMTYEQRNAIENPVEGLMVICTNCTADGKSVLSYFSDGKWVNVSAGCATPNPPPPGIHIPSISQIVWNWTPTPIAQGYKWNTTNDYGSATDMGTSTTKTESGLICNTAYTRYVWAYNICGPSTATTLTQSTSACPWTCGQSYTDSRDGQTYNTVQLGSQCWMAQNLNYETGNSCCYDYNSSNCNIYGRLYDWQTAVGACPSGWHLPTDAEWATLTDYVNSQPSYQCNNTSGWIAKAMADTILWNSSTNTCAIGNNLSLNNATGFSGLPGGYRDYYNYFINVEHAALWWSLTEYDSDQVWIHALYFADPQAKHYDSGLKEYGLSVRCLRD